jgi:excisionase family DNA binding protein
VNGDSLTVTLPDEFVERIAARAAQLVLAELADREHGNGHPEWLDVPGAAAYLSVSQERIRKLQARGELPHYQEAPGCRVLFNRSELDAAMRRWRTP